MTLEALLVVLVFPVGHDEQRPRLGIALDGRQQQVEELANLVEDGVGDHVLAGNLMQLL